MSAHAHQHHDEAGYHGAAGNYHEANAVKLYVTIFVALLVLTAATVAASYVPLGDWHIPVAIGIAVFKALLVLLFFMHLLGGNRLQWLVVAAAGCFATIFASLIGADYVSRDWYLPPPAPLPEQVWEPEELSATGKPATAPAAVAPPEAER